MALQVPGQIDVDRIVPVGVFPFEDRLEGLDAGIGEENVEPAESRHGLVRGGAERREIALVDARFAPARPGGLDQTAGLAQFALRRGEHFKRGTDRPCNVDTHDGGALAGERDGCRPPDPARGAGHDGGFAQQPA